MRTLTAIALCALLFACPEELPPQPPPRPTPVTVAMLSDLAGKVTLTRDGASNPATNGALYEGDVLATGGGGHALLRGGGREVELLENSRFTVGKSLAELSLDVGELVFLESDAGAYQTSLGSGRLGAGAGVKLRAGGPDGGDTFEVGVGELELLDVDTDGGATLKAGQRFVVGVGVLELEEVQKPPEVVKPTVKLTPRGAVTVKPKSGPLAKLPAEGRELQEPATFAVEKTGQLNAEAKGARGTFSGGAKGSVEPVDGDAGFKVTLREGVVRIFMKEGESVLLDGKKQLQLKAKSNATAVVTATKQGPRVDVVGGDVGAALGSDEPVDLPAGESAQVKGTTLSLVKRGAPVLTLPAGRNARVNWAKGGDVLLQLEEGAGEAEVATDAQFENVLLTSKGNELQVAAPLHGSLSWRRAGGEAAQARFERDESAGAVAAKSDTVAETGLKATVYFQGAVPTLTFTFPPRDDAASWRFRVYAAGDLKSPLVDKRVNENKALVESGTLAEGSYLWSAVATLNSGAEASGGRMNKMDIVFDNSVTRLVLTSPKEGQRAGTAAGIAPLGARLTLNGKPITLDDSGRFTAPLPSGAAAIFRLTTREGADSYWVRRLGK